MLHSAKKKKHNMNATRAFTFLILSLNCLHIASENDWNYVSVTYCFMDHRFISLDHSYTWISQ